MSIPHALDVPGDALLSLVDNAPDVISRFDREGRYLFISKAAERATGIPREAFLGKTYRELGFAEENCVLWDAALRHTFGTGEPTAIDFSVTLPSGVRHYEGTSTPERGPDGSIVAVLTVTRDITERVEASQAIREHAERLHLALDAARMGTWEWEVSTGQLTWAGHLEEIHGMPPGSFDGKFETFVGIIHEEDRERVLATIARALEQGGDFATEFRVPFPDGAIHWVVGEGSAFHDASGNPERMVGIGWDVTARKRSEVTLRETAERLRETAQRLTFHVENTPLANIEWDSRFCVSSWSAQAEEIFGWTSQEVVGKRPEEFPFIHPEDQSEVASVIVRLTDGTDPNHVFHTRNLTKDRRVLHFEWYNSALRDEQNNLVSVLSLGQDVTEREEAQAALRARAEREALLNRIGHVLRSIPDPVALQAAVARELGEALAVDRCYFVQYDLSRNTAQVAQDWRRPGLPSLSGTYRLSDYGLNPEALYRINQTLVVSDIHAEARIPSRIAQMLAEAGICAGIGASIYESGGLVSSLNVAVAATPRTWTSEEIAILEAVATQTGATLEAMRLRERERQIAERLQDALRPALAGKVPGLDADAFYLPALNEASIGGDFFDVVSLEKGCYALIVADLAGKGLAAAAQTATVRHMLRAYLYQRGMTLAESVNLLNSVLTEHGLLTGFTTLFVGAYDVNRRTLTYVNAGQEPGLLLRSGSRRMEQLVPTGPVLGGFGEARFEERTLQFAPGDTLALFTDGLTESGPSRKDLLNLPGVADLLQKAASDPSATATQIIAEVMEGVVAFASPGGIRDDVCLLVARVEP